MIFQKYSRALLLISLLSVSISGEICEAESLMPNSPPPGWTGSDLLLDGVALSGISQSAADANRIFVLHGQREVAMIDPASGSAESMGPLPGPLSLRTRMSLSGGFLIFVSENYADLEGTFGSVVRLDVLDIETRVWRQEVMAAVSQQILQSGDATPAVHKGEFRVTLSTGEILRWKTSDMSPLATLAPEYSNNRLRSVVSTSIGDDFCVGITDSDGHLVMERNGVYRKLAYPKNFKFTGKILTSEKFLVGSVTGFGRLGDGMMVWEKSKMAQAGRLLAPVIGYTEPEYSIWNGRYLVAFQASIDQENYKLLVIQDLETPGAKPVSIPLAAGLSRGFGVGISGKFFWSVSQTGGEGARLIKLPVFAVPRLVSVDIAPARTLESDGKLSFLVTADRQLTAPVTIKFRTLPGSAKGGIDYIDHQGTVTLTPSKPAAEVVVTVLQDLELESYESMILEITDVAGAWSRRPFTTGVIEGSGFGKLPDINGVPTASGPSEFAKEWILTDLGVVALTNVSSSEAGFHFFRFSSAKWERLTALGTISAFDAWYNKRIVDTLGNRVMVGVDRPNPQNPFNSYTLIALDLETGEISGTADSMSLEGMLHADGIVAEGNGAPARFLNHPFESSATAWEVPLTYSSYGRFSRLSKTTFVLEEPTGSFFVRNFPDGTVKEPFPGFVPHAVAGSFMVGNPPFGSEYIQLLNSSGTGNPVSHFFGETGELLEPVGVMENGIAILTQSSSNPLMKVAVDATTGAVLTTFPFQNGASVSGDLVAYGIGGRKLGLLRTTPNLPRVRDLFFTRSEGENASTWRLRLSEASGFPISARVIAPEGEVAAGLPVIIPAGGRDVVFPATVVDDSIPEDEMKIEFVLEISGDGHVNRYPCSVRIPANDYVQLPEPPKDENLEGSSVALHPTGIAIGSVTKDAAADLRNKKLYRPKDVDPNYGHTVEINARYLAVGAPSYPHPLDWKHVPGGSVHVYDRKTGKLVLNPKGDSGNISYGTVIRLDGERLFVASPRSNSKTGVKVMTIGKAGEIELRHPRAIGKNDRFGTAITSKGNYVWIGAPGSNRVYQFMVNSGKLVRILQPPATEGSFSGASYQNFGQSLEIIGTSLFIGAPAKTASSSVLRFNLNNGKFTGGIYCPLLDGGYFGASLAALKGSGLAIGCPASALSPAGGLLLYRNADRDPKLVTMLRPPKPSGVRNRGQALLGLGISGGLSASGNVIGLVTGKLDDPLDVITARFTAEGYSKFKITILDLAPFIASHPQTAPLAAASRPLTVWEKAVGPGTTGLDLGLGLTRDEHGEKLALPDVVALGFGTRLVVERSSDLKEWTPVAALDADVTPEWRSLGTAILSEPSILEFPHAEGDQQRFYRIRCEAP